MFRATATKMFTVICIVLLAANLYGAAEAKSKLSTGQKLELIKSVGSSQVQVEYYLKVDKGDSPKIGGMTRYCPSCGEYHAVGSGSSLIDEERPLEVAGYMVGDGLVQTVDILTHSRFIDKVLVRYNGNAVSAAIASYSKDTPTVLLKLEGELQGATPLNCKPKAKEPYYIISYDKLNGTWMNNINPMAAKLTVNELGQKYLNPGETGIAVAKDGSVAGVIMGGELAVDDSWKGDPVDMEWISADQMDNMVARIERIADAGILRVKINLRSPKKSSMASRYYSRGSDDGEGKTEIDTLAVVTGSKRAIVLANMKQKATARLERITLFTKSGEAIKASFAGTLSDYGAIIVDLDKEVNGAIEFADKDIRKYRKEMLPCASITVKGSKRIAYHGHNMISGFDNGWHNQVYPSVSNNEEGSFLFDKTGKLVAIPIARRKRVEEDYWYGSDQAPLTAVAYISGVLGDLAKNIDKSNVPLTEAEENRLAWLGVELQPLDKELARINNVSDQTDNGRRGGLVSYVYADSPASKAGIEPGMVLIRLHIEDQAKPIEIELSDAMSYMSDFPWDQYDMIPDSYFDQIPQPWGGAENSFTRSLTDIGFGKKFTAEFSNSGQIVKKDFTVVESPAHYDSAKRYKSKELGLTVRNMTYEVRRYFQKLDDDPGVIVSKVESGEKAAVSGIKPYEIVTQINDETVNNVDDFERLVKDQQELRISVKRKMAGRVVKIKM